MAYKIAVASSDEINIDHSFGGAEEFLIYEVSDDGVYHLEEKRSVTTFNNSCSSESACTNEDKGCGKDAIGNASTCGDSVSGVGRCGGASKNNPKVLLIEDCRCIICQKIGFQVQKQLEKKAIVSFDVSCEIEEALQKITTYFKRVDAHQSLRGIANY